FADPANVTGEAGPPVWWVQYYLHLLGPLLQWIDMLFIHRNLRAFRAAFAGLFAVILVYILWVEIVVGPFNDSPFGEITDGLPYPFLNDLVLAERGIFYVQTTISAFVVLGVIWGLSRLLRRATP
ncbi:MAG: hypothetical protein AAFR35_16455, partial [Pseudomonadota bacterium]